MKRERISFLFGRLVCPKQKQLTNRRECRLMKVLWLFLSVPLSDAISSHYLTILCWSTFSRVNKGTEQSKRKIRGRGTKKKNVFFWVLFSLGSCSTTIQVWMSTWIDTSTSMCARLVWVPAVIWCRSLYATERLMADNSEHFWHRQFYWLSTRIFLLVHLLRFQPFQREIEKRENEIELVALVNIGR